MRQRVAESAWGLALAVVEVQKARLRHALEVAAEVGIDVLVDGSGVGDEVVDPLVRLQGRAALGVDPQVPRPQPVQAQVLALAIQQSPGHGQDRLLDGLVEPEAVLGRVVETVLLAVRVIAEVSKARVPGDLLPQVVHPVEQTRDGVAPLDVGLELVAERALAHRAVVDLQVRPHLLGRLLRAVPVDGHRPDHLGPLGRQLRQLREQRHVGFAEQFHLVAEAPHGCLEVRRHVAELDEPALQPDALLVGLRPDVALEPQARRLALGVGGVAHVREVGQGRGLGEHRLELGPVGEPLLDIAVVHRPGRQLLVVGHDVPPRGVLEPVGRIRQCYHHTPAEMLQRSWLEIFSASTA